MPILPKIMVDSVRLTLLVRAYCSLCDDMQRMVMPLAAAHGIAVDVIDVDAHPALEAEWGDRVPVLFLGSPEEPSDRPPGGGLAPSRREGAQRQGCFIELCHYHFHAENVNAALATLPRNDPVDARAKVALRAEIR